MTRKTIYHIGLVLVVLSFVALFCILVLPPIVAGQDIISAFGAGFVNPFAAGYSSDVLCCWAILLFWVIWESNTIKYGWACVLLGIVPGVAVGFGLYLLMRSRQLEKLKGEGRI